MKDIKDIVAVHLNTAEFPHSEVKQLANFIKEQLNIAKVVVMPDTVSLAYYSLEDLIQVRDRLTDYIDFLQKRTEDKNNDKS